MWGFSVEPCKLIHWKSFLRPVEVKASSFFHKKKANSYKYVWIRITKYQLISSRVLTSGLCSPALLFNLSLFSLGNCLYLCYDHYNSLTQWNMMVVILTSMQKLVMHLWQFQTLLRIVLLCGLDLKHNHHTSAIKPHWKLLRI